METKIGPDLRKPFRGLTTIQLFDKNTGELIEEYHDENTYNDRLQYINYLDTVLKCKSPSIPSTVSPFTRIVSDNISDDSTSFLGLLSKNCLGETSNVLYARQLFATLWLTNDTKAETAHGYPNGFPVGIADTAGISSSYTSYACSGMLNRTESYVGNDRLHLVFDFATDKCNAQFDALWLFPSTIRHRGSTIESWAYDVASFYQAQEISSEELNTQLLSKYTNFIVNYKINGNYTVLGYGPNVGGSNRDTYALQILNNSTGEIVATIDWSSSKCVYAPMYYDAGTNTLYMLRTYSYKYPSNVLSTNSENCALYKMNMSSGTITKVGNLYNMLGIRWADFNAVANDAGACYTFVNAFKKDGSVVSIFRLKCVSALDSSIKNYFVLFNFDPVTETFIQIKKFEVFDDNAYDSQYMFMVDNTVYIMSKLSSSQQPNYTFSAFDINTGAIKSTNIISPNSSILNNIWMPFSFSSASSGDEARVYQLQDHAEYRRALCSTSSQSSVVGCKVYKRKYFTAPWSTHNKLTSAIKKTDMTTMKIQYDIVWDSIPDVILPALL